MRVFELRFEVVLPLDQHPCGVRCQRFLCATEREAVTALHSEYSVRPGSKSLRMLSVSDCGAAR